MDIEELVQIYKQEKSWISSRLSTIDNLLDRAAYGNSSNEEDLKAEYDHLEIRLDEIRIVADLIGQVNELNRKISLLEMNVNTLGRYNGDESKVDNINQEIINFEEDKKVLLEKIKVLLKVNEEPIAKHTR